MTRPPQNTRFLISFVLAALIIISPLLLNYFFLSAHHEFREISEVAVEQQSANGIYGTAIHSNDFEYRMQLAHLRRSDVLAIGSSRTQQFREEYFSSSFTCACLVAHDLTGVEGFLAELLPEHQPKLIIIGLDYEWFLNDFVEGTGISKSRTNHQALAFSKLMRPYEWAMDGRLSFDDFVETLSGRDLQNSLLNFPQTGLAAIRRMRGIRRDGSYFNGYVTSGAWTGYPWAQFRHDIKVIRATDNNVWPSGQILAGRIERLRKIIEMAETAGSKVILMLLPFPERILDELDRHPASKALSQVGTMIRDWPRESYDFTDGRKLGGGDCEYLDGRHGGDVVYMRILRDLLEQNPSSLLAPHVQLAQLTKDIERFSGFSVARYAPDLYGFPETDFLKLECPKG